MVRLRELSDLLPKEVLLSFPDSTFGCCGDCEVLQGREQRLSQGCSVGYNSRETVYAGHHVVSSNGYSCHVLCSERTQS
ncbi:hypothetical protein T05_10748 [Trichinella murrelli]|uniref:Uncharacterized protein n=1 Tax=Trichinella murrelli TaxID=144512 RepID=A0A0V0T3A5_9BILA|nr:hypothetical protein T05_10748 [Trichinella murrelli]